MLGRRVLSLFKSSPSSQISRVNSVNDEATGKGFCKKAVSFILITVTDGVALGALDDLAIHYSCSSKAMEKATKNQAIIDALGEPIKKGSWYDASLAFSTQKEFRILLIPRVWASRDWSLTTEGNDSSCYSFILSRNWEILMMDALLHIPGNEEKQQTSRINISDSTPSDQNPEKKLESTKS